MALQWHLMYLCPAPFKMRFYSVFRKYSTNVFLLCVCVKSSHRKALLPVCSDNINSAVLKEKIKADNNVFPGPDGNKKIPWRGTPALSLFSAVSA
jgi:hypothetical protein